MGKVGSGKSSLLAAITAEMRKEGGWVAVRDVGGGFGLVGQEAWIQHGTLRDNVLFGCRMEQRRYDEVLEACALLPDIKVSHRCSYDAYHKQIRTNKSPLLLT